MEEFLNEQDFTEEAKKFAQLVRMKAKANALRFNKGRKGDYTYKTSDEGGKSRYQGYVEKRLASSIRSKITKKYGEVDMVSFVFPLHGIFRECGVGNGQPAMDSKAKRAQRIYIKRSPSDWISEPIAQNIDDFATLTADYYGDKILKVVQSTNQ